MRESRTLEIQDPDAVFASHPDLMSMGQLNPVHDETAVVDSLRRVETHASWQWFDADKLAGVREARLASAGIGHQILEQRMHQLREGDFDNVPNPVDPLTTAQRALAAKEQHGELSPQYNEAYHSLVVDSQRLLAEGMRKLTWEYFPEIEQRYDPHTGGYSFMGRQLLDMVHDGITPVAEPEERQYRISEYVEEATYGAVRKYGKVALNGMVEQTHGAAKASHAEPEVRVFTISECADWAIDAHKRKSKAGHGGYVPEIQKLMIRGVRYDQTTGNRFQEQLGLPGVYITHAIVVQALQVLGISAPGRSLSKQEVRAKQMVALGGEGVISFAALLDDLASKASGKRIFMGEVIPEEQPKNYRGIQQDAIDRQAQLDQSSHDLADFLMGLEESGTDHWESQGIVEAYVKKIIFHQVKHDPVQAGKAFDQKTEATLQQAAQARAQGNEAHARRLEEQAENSAPAVVFCGAGSCGLEAVDPNSKQTEEMKEKLKAKSGDTVLKDTERSCKNCGKLGIWYAFDKKRVNKACENCGASEIKG